MIKYFQHTGTINGTNFLLRHFLSIMIIFASAFGLGFYFVKEIYPLVILFSLTMSVFFYMNFINYIKRVRALFPDHVIPIIISLAFLNVISVISNGQSMGVLVNLVVLIINSILIFKNSNIETHNG